MINEIADHLKIDEEYLPKLSPEEMELWNNLAPKLIEEGIVNSSNISLLNLYCKLQVIYKKLIVKDPTHYMTDKYRNQISNLEKQLCLTPATYASWIRNQLAIKDKVIKQEERLFELEKKKGRMYNNLYDRTETKNQKIDRNGLVLNDEGSIVEKQFYLPADYQEPLNK